MIVHHHQNDSDKDSFIVVRVDPNAKEQSRQFLSKLPLIPCKQSALSADHRQQDNMLSTAAAFDSLLFAYMSILMHNSACVHFWSTNKITCTKQYSALAQLLCAFNALLCGETCSQVCSLLGLPDICTCSSSCSFCSTAFKKTCTASA